MRRPNRHDQRGTAVLRTWLRALISSAVATGLYFVVPITPGDLQGAEAYVRFGLLAAALPVLALLVGRQVKRALATGQGVAERVSTLLIVVNIVIAFFSLIYYAMADQFSGLDSRLDGLYFSVTTLCTVGFGDITAVSQTARAIVTVQMVFDLVVVTSALSIIVSAVRDRRPAG